MQSRILAISSKGLWVGVGIGLLSFLLPIVPCHSESHWTLCRLPDPFANLPDLSTTYYGSNNPLTGLVLQVLIPLVIFLLIFLSVRKKAGKMLDLTRK